MSRSRTTVGYAPDRARQSADPNLEISGLLHDLSHVYRDEPKRMAYRRAAAVVAGMDRPIVELVHDGRLEKLPRVGPAIERIILEYLETGVSDTVERAVATASTDRQRAIITRRGARGHFFSVARARQILLEHRPGVVAAHQYRGDLQQHSLWSDGSETLEEIVDDSIRLGQRYAAVTDHYGLAIANGLSADGFIQQHGEIDALNARYPGPFRLLKGVEANILADGTIDLPDAARPSMDIIVAAPHSLLRRRDDQTARMVGAVRQRGVNILGHPRGRRFNDRVGLEADWDEVFGEAAAHQVAIELDGTWERQDVDYVLATRALRHGCLFAVDSDAHGGRERHFSAIGLAHARLAGIPSERIVNCWPVDKLLDWAHARRP